MKAGIIGLPGSGKSTLWCFLTGTLEGPDPAQIGRLQAKTVRIRDERLERLRDDYQPKKYTPATIELGDFPAVKRDERDRADIAELLAPARSMEVLIVVLRGFETAFLPDAPEPLRDWEDIAAELLLSDLVIVEKRIEKLQVQAKKPTPTQAEDRKELELMERVRAHLEVGNTLVDFPFNAAERKTVQGYQFLSQKPQVPVINRSETFSGPQLVDALREKTGCEVFDVPALNELEIEQLPEDERDAFRKEFGVVPGTRDSILAQCYRAAGLHSFFTVGEKDVRAWTIRNGATAVEAAGEIHSDIARGFIRAETLRYEDYVQCSGHKAAKEMGQLRLEGKEYVVKDGDIIEFRFNV